MKKVTLVVYMATVKMAFGLWDVNSLQLQMVANGLSGKECQKLLRLAQVTGQQEIPTGIPDYRTPDQELGKSDEGPCLQGLKAWASAHSQDGFQTLSLLLDSVGRMDLDERLATVVMHEKSVKLAKTLARNPFRWDMERRHAKNSNLSESNPGFVPYEWTPPDNEDTSWGAKTKRVANDAESPSLPVKVLLGVPRGLAQLEEALQREDGQFTDLDDGNNKKWFVVWSLMVVSVFLCAGGVAILASKKRTRVPYPQRSTRNEMQDA